MIKKSNKQGSVANSLGRAMEDSIEDQLGRAGFARHDGKLKAAFVRGVIDIGDEKLGDRWLMRNVKKYTNLYGVRFFSDFVLYDRTMLPKGLVIEVKSQETPGSVDEKYVFAVLSLRALYDKDGIPAWLVFGGSGVRACALDWMKSQELWRPNRQVFRFLNESGFRRAVHELQL